MNPDQNTAPGPGTLKNEDPDPGTPKKRIYCGSGTLLLRPKMVPPGYTYFGIGKKGGEPLAVDADTVPDDLVVCERQAQTVADHLHGPVHLLLTNIQTYRALFYTDIFFFLIFSL